MAEPGFMRMLKSLFVGGDSTMSRSRPSEDVSAAPAMARLATTDLDQSRIPAAAKDRVIAIQALLADLEQRAAERGMAVTDLIELTQIATVYLPRLLESYAAIPPKHRAEIFRDTGHSASFLLVERLDRIVERLGVISRDFAQGHLDAFSDNMRFIDMRYGASVLPFD